MVTIEQGFTINQVQYSVAVCTGLAININKTGEVKYV